MGTAASVQKVTAWTHPVPRYSLVLTGLCRFRVEEVRREVPFPVARVTQLDYRHEDGKAVHSWSVFRIASGLKIVGGWYTNVGG